VAHSWVDEGEVVKHGLVHTVHEGTICTRQPGFLIDKLLVKVTDVTGGFLHGQERGERLQRTHTHTQRHTHMHTNADVNKHTDSQPEDVRTTVGLKGGATSRFSRAFQSVSLKKEC
jgi:hypothetical protein